MYCSIQDNSYLCFIYVLCRVYIVLIETSPLSSRRCRCHENNKRVVIGNVKRRCRISGARRDHREVRCVKVSGKTLLRLCVHKEAIYNCQTNLLLPQQVIYVNISPADEEEATPVEDVSSGNDVVLTLIPIPTTARLTPSGQTVLKRMPPSFLPSAQCRLPI